MSQSNIELTIRSTIKKIDEMTFRCPLSWTIHQLKTFIAMTHQHGQEYFKPEKTQLYYAANILDDEQTLYDILKNKNLKQHYTFIAKFNAGLEPGEANKETNDEEEDRLKFLEDYSKLYINSSEKAKKKTNFEELNVFAKLPLMMDRVSRQLAKKKADDDGNIPREAFVNNNQEEERQNIVNLIVRIFVIYLLFGNYFDGIYFYVFIAVLVVYFLIKVSQKKRRGQQIPRPQQNQPQPNVPNVEGQAQDAAQQPAANQENAIKPTFINKVKEFVICYVCSLYPSWDMNHYIENHPVIQPENEATDQTAQEANATGENNPESAINEPPQDGTQNSGGEIELRSQNLNQEGGNKPDVIESQEEEKERLLPGEVSGEGIGQNGKEDSNNQEVTQNQLE